MKVNRRAFVLAMAASPACFGQHGFAGMDALVGPKREPPKPEYPYLSIRIREWGTYYASVPKSVDRSWGKYYKAFAQAIDHEGNRITIVINRPPKTYTVGVTIEKPPLREIGIHGGYKEYVVSPPRPATNPFRTWTDRTGKHTVEAYVLKANKARVRLYTKDGRKIWIDKKKLSLKDLPYAREKK